MKRGTNYMLSLLFFVFGYCDLKAQEKEPALARIFYEFIHVNDTTQPDKQYREEMVLYIGQNSTLFSSYASERMLESVQKQLDAPGFDGNVTLTKAGKSTKESYYFLPKNQALKLVYRLASETYTVDQDFPEFEWMIENKTKEIGGYTAQMVTTQFKGRNYTVWFTSELPFQVGPWKFHGLPGLILEVYDSKEEVFFNYAGFEKLDSETITFGLPENSISTDQKALDKLIKAIQKNPQAAMSARSQGKGSGSLVIRTGTVPADMSKIKSMTVLKNEDASETSAIDNNPLELTD